MKTLCFAKFAYQCFGNIELAYDPNSNTSATDSVTRARRHASCIEMGAVCNSVARRNLAASGEVDEERVPQ